MSTYTAGNYGEASVRALLVELKGTLISGFFNTKNIKVDGKNCQFDFVVMVPSIGLLNIEVKNWKGEVHATARDKWVRKINVFGEEKVGELPNASKQVLRSSALLMKLLEQEKMNFWPIRSLVVFAHQNGTFEVRDSQTDVIYMNELDSWIRENRRAGIHHKFTQNEFMKLYQILAENTQEYAA